jgi:hypothetical protein
MVTNIFNLNRTSSVIKIVVEIFYQLTYHAYHVPRSGQKASAVKNFSNVNEITGWLSCDQFFFYKFDQVHDN